MALTVWLLSHFLCAVHGFNAYLLYAKIVMLSPTSLHIYLLFVAKKKNFIKIKSEKTNEKFSDFWNCVVSRTSNSGTMNTHTLPKKNDGDGTDNVMQFICWLIDRLTLISRWFPLLCDKFPSQLLSKCTVFSQFAAMHWVDYVQRAGSRSKQTLHSIEEGESREKKVSSILECDTWIVTAAATTTTTASTKAFLK